MLSINWTIFIFRITNSQNEPILPRDARAAYPMALCHPTFLLSSIHYPLYSWCMNATGHHVAWNTRHVLHWNVVSVNCRPGDRLPFAVTLRHGQPSSNGVSSQRSRYVTQTSVVCRPNIRAPFHVVDYKPPNFTTGAICAFYVVSYVMY